MTLAIAIDFRAAMEPVRNQGRRPTCLSFATSDVHRHARQHPEWFCVEWLFYHVAQQAGTEPWAGTTIPDTRAVLHALGQPEETVWPYSTQVPSSSNWRPPATSPKLWASESAGCRADLNAIRAQIEQAVPVVIGLFVSDTFNNPKSWDRVGPEVVLGRDQGDGIDYNRGHAVVVVGRGQFAGEPVMLLRNSWGSRWGHDGHAWVREAYLGPRLSGGFVVSKGNTDVLQSNAGDAHASARLG